MIHIGSYVSASSVFIMAFSTSIWSSIVFVVVLSLGEALWSPRLNDYTMSIVKEGREGTFMAIANAPLFLVKLPTGIMSGYLLDLFCPEEGARRSKFMWAIIGVTTAVSPLLMTMFWPCISKTDEELCRLCSYSPDKPDKSETSDESEISKFEVHNEDKGF